tara:strand:- start:390 stop:2351 length:1962 start_codon:yes stop_codon:yes gene_type:complete
MFQTTLFEPDSNWEAPDTLPDFSQCKVVAIDLETCDPGLKEHGPGWPMNNGHVAGIALTFVYDSEEISMYLPIAHQMGGNMAKSWVINYVKKLCADERIEKVFHNAMYDIGWLSTLDIEVAEPYYDTMFAAALLDEDRYSYSLDSLAKDWCGVGKNEALLNEASASFGIKGKNVKSNMWRLHPRFVGPYAEADTIATIALWKYTRQKIKSSDLQGIFDLELSLIPMLLKMRKQGIKVDTDRAEVLRKQLSQKKKDTLQEIYRKFGCNVDVWASKSLASAFDHNNLKYGTTPKGAPSFTKEFLAGHPHELPQMILRCRKIEKTINTFVEGMILKQSFNGRIHCELHPLKSDDGGTVSGRFSCSNPNLQQTSARDPEFGPLVRSLFLPEKGSLWGALDYSSQEPRLTVHYSALTHQQGSTEAVHMFNKDPRTDYHQMVADLANIDRKHAKTLNLGLAYGMGEVKMCEGLGLPTEWMTGFNGKQRQIAGSEGKALIEAYHEKVPFVRGLTDTCSNIALDRGFIKTLLGRRCRFDSWEPIRGYAPAVKGKEAAEEKHGKVRRAYTHKALNKLIQGSAADMTKAAMLEIHKEGITPMLQMHDELDFSFDNEKDAKRCTEIMENCVKLEVPVIVDAEFGTNWGNATQTFKDNPWKDLKQ